MLDEILRRYKRGETATALSLEYRYPLNKIYREARKRGIRVGKKGRSGRPRKTLPVPALAALVNGEMKKARQLSGWTMDALYGKRSRLGLPPLQPKLRDTRAIRAMRKAGGQYKEIAATFGIHPDTARTACSGIPKPPTRGQLQVAILHEMGVQSWDAVADCVGKSRQCTRQIYQNYLTRLARESE